MDVAADSGRTRAVIATTPSLKGLIEDGKVTPVIDRTYPLTDTPEAIGHVAAGHARGTVVITVAS